MANKASALTYSTLLAIVPILRHFICRSPWLRVRQPNGTPVPQRLRRKYRNDRSHSLFCQFYLSQTKGGVFIGVGLVMLLWTVINLVSNIEITFNRIWEVKKARSMYRKITDYFSMFLLMPILIVVSGGLSLFMSTILKQMD